MAKVKSVYQFKIELLETQPLIWRRIQIVSTETFWGLHCAIQDSMGWLDYHLHQFHTKDPHANSEIIIGIPDLRNDRDLTKAGWNLSLSDYPVQNKHRFLYEYDFGDRWFHEIYFEGEYPAAKSIKYPICLAGERSCPPEDCGGVDGYFRFLEEILNPLHKEHKSTLQWHGKLFYPERFDVSTVKFDNSIERLRKSGLL